VGVIGALGAIGVLAYYASRGQEDRVAEEEAREFYDAHGRWPDES
jgi:hypothetical protein